MARRIDPQVRRRRETFAERPRTRLWCEVPSADNPYVAERALCHGYDLEALAGRVAFDEMVWLLLSGELPTPPQRELFGTLLTALANPGPRHPATRGVMAAAVSKADPVHLLPIGLSLLGGTHVGAAEVAHAMTFLQRHRGRDADETAAECHAAPYAEDAPAPGFGTRYAAADPIAARLASRLAALEAGGEALAWGEGFAAALAPAGQGWRPTGVAAAALLDLGLPPRCGPGVFQLAAAAGLLAHGAEMTGQPTTAMPLPDEEHHVIEDD